MSHDTKGNPRASQNARRQYPLVSASGVGVNWDDVPDDVIVELVRSYTASGDAILFGTSHAQDVCAIRVYRGKEPYSVYFRKASQIGEAVDRLYRYRPVRKPQATPGAVCNAGAQGGKSPPLKLHPSLTVDAWEKLQKEKEKRAQESIDAWTKACMLYSAFHGNR